MDVALAIDLAPTEPIARQIARALRHAIVTMRIRPGEMLSEQDIATRLGVSRQPVREAFIKLGEAGLIRVLPQRGTLRRQDLPRRGRGCPLHPRGGRMRRRGEAAVERTAPALAISGR